MSSEKANKEQKKKPFRKYGRKPEEEKGIPLLRYGKGNNFYKFRSALSDVTTEKFGNLGKLIDLEQYYVPRLVLTDFEAQGYSDAQVERLELEEFKEHCRKVSKMEDDRPKLFGLIMQHMSIESKDKVAQDKDYETWMRDKDPEKLWQAIIRTHKVDCVSNVDAVKELTARKSYQNIKQGSFKTLAQYSARFRDTYKSYKATGTVERPVDVTEKEQALDFFHGLDQARYATFKTSMLNGWATKAFDPPDTPNDIYRIVGSWVKPATKMEGGPGATFVTIEEDAKLNKKRNEKLKASEKKKKAAAVAAAAAAMAMGGSTEDGDKKTPKDLSHIECFRCKEPGHYSSSKDCPLHPSKQKTEFGAVNSTWQEYKASIYTTVRIEEEELEEHTVTNAVHVTQGLLPMEVLLDNQANISILHPMLLSNVKKAKQKIRVKGVGGTQLIVNMVGHLDGFFEVHASEHTKANVLSFADVEDLYEITYTHGDSFVVHMSDDKHVEFKRRDKLYVADWVEGRTYATVQENESVYTKEEVRRAKQAYELVKNSGYPSPSEMLHLLQDGNIRGLPTLGSADIERAYKIYGVHPEYVRGQLTKKKVGRTQVDLGLRSTEKSLRLYTDVMHIEGNMFLITVTDPLNLTLQYKIENEGRMSLGIVLQNQIAVLQSRAFEPKIVYTDPHSTFRSMTQEFPGVEIDVGGKGDYVAKVDVKIRRIKETFRKVLAGLPWSLPKQLVGDLVAYAVSRLNIRRTTALAENVCPKVLFTGIPVDYRKELQLAFGDYVEAYEGTTNTMAQRSSACIALHPAANSTGSWILWKIEIRSRVRRSNMVKLVTSKTIIKTMNAIAQEDVEEEQQPGRLLENLVSRQPAMVDNEQGEEAGNQVGIQAETQGNEQLSEEAEAQESTDDDEEESGTQAPDLGVVTTRSGRVVTLPSRYAAVTKVSRSEWEQESADAAIKGELRQLFLELVALIPLKRHRIPKTATILKSHMFLVNKYLANGEFDKVKARLVADGRDQDQELYPDKSSPTVTIHSVFTVLGLACQKRWRIVIKIDIKGAFVQTPMTGHQIFMKLDPKITKYAREMCPEFDEFIWRDGCLYTVLLKAMYGCIQASPLWYAYIRKEIEKMGYTASETDRCVFVKQVGDRIFILMLYVDNIMAIVDEEEAKKLKSRLEKLFGVVQFEVGDKMSYLGMNITIGDQGTTVDMTFYARQLLEGEQVDEYGSPGTKSMFIVKSSKALSEDERKWFHSKTAKLLYLAKRARPDILTAVIFLCTRVQEATEEDKDKLQRVLGYLKHTQHRTLMLQAHGHASTVTAYVDAAYAIHDDSKSQSGVVIYMGRTLAYVSSRKQKCMSKSPTEAELIALTDNLGLVELFREFLEFVTQGPVPIPVVYQDCNAVLTLVTKGGGQTRTKHLRARMHLGKEMVDEERIKVIYSKAKDMQVDGFSKPYEPAKQGPFSTLILGKDVNKVIRWALQIEKSEKKSEQKMGV